jgi:hypothetical protein
MKGAQPVLTSAGRDEDALCEIRVKGHLDVSWSDWLDGLTIDPQACGDTLLTGPLRDPASLHGLLNKTRDLGLPLLSVERRRCPGMIK